MKGTTILTRTCKRMGLQCKTHQKPIKLDNDYCQYAVISNKSGINLEVYIHLSSRYTVVHNGFRLYTLHSQRDLVNKLLSDNSEVFTKLRDKQQVQVVRRQIGKDPKAKRIDFEGLLRGCHLKKVVDFIQEQISRYTCESSYAEVHKAYSMEANNQEYYEATIKISTENKVYWLTSYSNQIAFSTEVLLCRESATEDGELNLITQIKSLLDLSTNTENYTIESTPCPVCNKTECRACFLNTKWFPRWLASGEHTVDKLKVADSKNAVGYQINYNIGNNLKLHVLIKTVDSLKYLSQVYTVSLYDPIEDKVQEKTDITKGSLCKTVDTLVTDYLQKYRYYPY